MHIIPLERETSSELFLYFLSCQVVSPPSSRSRAVAFLFPLCAGCLHKYQWIMTRSANLCNPEKKTRYCQRHAWSRIVINHL